MTEFTKDNVQSFFADRREVLSDLESVLKALKASFEMVTTRTETQKATLVSQLQQALENTYEDIPDGALERLVFLMARYPKLTWGKVAGKIKLMSEREKTLTGELSNLPTWYELTSCIKLSKSFIRGEEQKIIRESLSSIRSSTDLMRVKEICELLPPEMPLEPARQMGWVKRLLPQMKKRQKLVQKLDAAWVRASRFHKQDELPGTPEQVVEVMEDRQFIGRELGRMIQDEQSQLRVYEDQLKSVEAFSTELEKCNNEVALSALNDGLAEMIAWDDSSRQEILSDLGLSELSTTWQSIFEVDMKAQGHLKANEQALADIDENRKVLNAFQALMKTVLKEVSQWTVGFEDVDEQISLLVVDNDLPLSDYPFLKHSKSDLRGDQARDLGGAITKLFDDTVDWLKLSGVCPNVSRRIRNFELDDDFSTLNKRRYYSEMMTGSFFDSGSGGSLGMSSSGYSGGCGGGSDSGSCSSSSSSSGSDGGC